MCEFICIERVCIVLSICYCKIKSAIYETALVSKKKKKRMVPFDWLVLANKQQNVALKIITLKK